MEYNSPMLPTQDSTFQADPLWGDIALDEPLIAALVASPPVQRLKGIHQAGASYYLLPEKCPGTRFEHSLGVMQLLRMLGAGLEEQIAGLLHDVPHTAFAHTADIVFPNDGHNFHERFQHAIITASPVPEILRKYGVPLRAALEPDTYPLLEQPLPDLCADRIDYSLRDLLKGGFITSREARDFVAHLVPTAGGILVNDVDAALWFAHLFSKANDTYWTGPEEAGAYWALAGAIKRAYRIGAFTDNNLFSTDDAAMDRLRAAADPVVDAYLRLLEPGTIFYEVGEGSGAPHFKTHMKQRLVDPKVIAPSSSEAKRLSQLSGEYARHAAKEGSRRNNYYRLWSDKIVDPDLAAQGER